MSLQLAILVADHLVFFVNHWMCHVLLMQVDVCFHKLEVSSMLSSFYSRPCSLPLIVGLSRWFVLDVVGAIWM